jgi:hypothetical protein
MANHSKLRTQTQAKKAQRTTEGAKAMSEYNAERQAERAKTVRLKALREAKEAAESGPRRSGATSKSPGLTLSPDDPLAKPRKKVPSGKK